MTEKENITPQHSALILLSGGIDSSTCAHIYKSIGYNVEALYIDYGQKAATREKIAAQKVSDFLKIKLHTLTLVNSQTKSSGEIVSRNAFLIFTAIMECNPAINIIAIGIHSGTTYYDCSPNFLIDVQNISNNYTSGSISICAPFIYYTKKEVWNLFLNSGIPFDLTYSCENGNTQPCGECSTCMDLMELQNDSH